MANFAEITDQLDQAGGAVEVADAAALGEAIARLLAKPKARQRLAKAASGVAESNAGVIDRMMTALEPVLGPGRTDKAA